MTCHDIGRNLGCYGVKTVSTPNLDRLAGEGIRFESLFCAAPTCSPSRAALFTGRWPHCTGLLGLTHGAFEWDMNEDQVHMARYLSEAGYATACVGVMHETHTHERWGYDHLDLFEGQHRPNCDALTDGACR